MSDEFSPVPDAAAEPAAVPVPEPVPVPPDSFPISLEEYAATRRLDPMWPAGLAAFGGTTWRHLPEWDALLAAFQVKPVQNQ